MRRRGGSISAVSADGVAAKPYFYRNHNMGRGARCFPLRPRWGGRACWGQQGAGGDHPVAALAAAKALTPRVLPPPAAGAALSLPAPAAGVPRSPRGAESLLCASASAGNSAGGPFYPRGETPAAFAGRPLQSREGLCERRGGGRPCARCPHLGSGVALRCGGLASGFGALPTVCSCPSPLAGCSYLLPALNACEGQKTRGKHFIHTCRGGRAHNIIAESV